MGLNVYLFPSSDKELYYLYSIDKMVYHNVIEMFFFCMCIIIYFLYKLSDFKLSLIIYEYLQKKLIMIDRREERGREGGEEGWEGGKEQNNLGKALKVTTSPL